MLLNRNAAHKIFSSPHVDVFFPEAVKSTVMSFGFSTGDIVLCVHLAHKVWREARDAANDFRNVSTEVASFKLVLEEVQVSISERQIDEVKKRS